MSRCLPRNPSATPSTNPTRHPTGVGARCARAASSTPPWRRGMCAGRARRYETGGGHAGDRLPLRLPVAAGRTTEASSDTGRKREKGRGRVRNGPMAGVHAHGAHHEHAPHEDGGQRAVCRVVRGPRTVAPGRSPPDVAAAGSGRRCGGGAPCRSGRSPPGCRGRPCSRARRFRYAERVARFSMPSPVMPPAARSAGASASHRGRGRGDRLLAGGACPCHRISRARCRRPCAPAASGGGPARRRPGGANGPYRRTEG